MRFVKQYLHLSPGMKIASTTLCKRWWDFAPAGLSRSFKFLHLEQCCTLMLGQDSCLEMGLGD